MAFATRERRAIFVLERHALDVAAAHGDRLEHDLEPGSLRVRGDPGRGSTPYPPSLFGVDHLERVAEVASALLLHLSHDEPAPAPEHEVELVPSCPHVRGHDSVSAEPIVPERNALPVIHATRAAGS